MAEVSTGDQEGAVGTDLRTTWRWLSIVAIERRMSGLAITVQDDQQPTDKFVVLWTDVPVYAVRDENFTNFDKGGEGGPLKQLTETRFLDWATEATWNHEGAPLIHWQIAGSDDVVDVASLDRPVVSKIR
tara:strand:- start:515 stop:904 length:390 start_codon:yes stop_codon:yes gene_type:complete